MEAEDLSAGFGNMVIGEDPRRLADDESWGLRARQDRDRDLLGVRRGVGRWFRCG
jgi:hypothetical protein